MIDSKHDEAPERTASPGPSGDELTRQEAIKQIERERRFKVGTATATVGILILAIIWATTEYNNAGGWPSHGFSQSSSIPHVWNIWIIYPLLAFVFLTAAAYWNVYWRRPISEDEIQREIDRQMGRHQDHA